MPHKYNEDVETRLAGIVLDQEVGTATRNQSLDLEDFQSMVDLFDAYRSEKEYDWMSDIFIPEFPAQMLTQTSLDVDQYFRTRDFVETYVQDESQEALDSAGAAQELLNRTLNRRTLYHYQKFVRSKNLNHINGNVWLKCWWEREVDRNFQGFDEDTGEEQFDEQVGTDQFNYEVLDPRNCFTDNTYTYSLQQKKWITIRSERTLDELIQEQAAKGYFNLDLLKEVKPQKDTETKKKIRDIDFPQAVPMNLISPAYDIYERHGLMWMMENGEPGINREGEVLDGAKQRETVTTYAVSASTRILIGFHEQPHEDAYGKRYRPVIRGLCYIHPTKDEGAGDGKYARELQVGINDTFNLSNDRTRLATMPTMKGKRYVTEDNDTIYFEPGHIMELENPREDVEEFKIDDNIQAALTQISLLKNQMNEAMSIFPTTMGNLPAQASTTATAVMGAEQRTGQRTNYKSMTFEYTALLELYWMIQQMTYQYATPKTAQRLMGEKVYDFDPTLEYFYKPLSQSIESEQSKGMKIQRWTTILQTIVQSPHPDMPKMFNYIVLRIMELMGDEYMNFAATFLDTRVPLQEQGGTGAGSPAAPGGLNPEAFSNQNLIPMGSGEIATRAAANETGGGFGG